jgi:hypothetical protein
VAPRQRLRVIIAEENACGLDVWYQWCLFYCYIRTTGNKTHQIKIKRIKEKKLVLKGKVCSLLTTWTVGFS